MWEFKECREAIRQEMWSHSKAENVEKQHNRTIRFPPAGDSYADIDRDEDEDDVISEYDSRRFFMIEEQKTRDGDLEDDFGYGGIPLEELDDENSLIHRKNNTKGKKKTNSSINESRNERRKESERVKLISVQNMDEDDSAV